MTDIDLGFNPFEKRDTYGRWVRGHSNISKALSSAPPGSTFKDVSVKGLGGGRAHDRVYTKRLDGKFSGKTVTGKSVGVHSVDQIIAKTYGKGHLMTPNDQRLAHNAKMTVADKRRLAKGARGRLGTTDDLSVTWTDEIDLDWTKWNSQRRTSVAGSTRRPAAGNARAAKEILNFKKTAGLGGGARLGNKAMAVLKRRATMPGHLRAKAILAASRGNVQRANKLEAARLSQRVLRNRKPKAPKAFAAPRPPATRITPAAVQRRTTNYVRR